MRVLLVEDDLVLANMLRQELTQDGHSLSVVGDSAAAVEAVAALRPDVMILDCGLSAKDEMQVVATVAERFRLTSVLVLTGLADIEETVRYLELGADDVVNKPFSFQELRARLRALERRRGHFGDRVLRFGDLEMDRAGRRVTQAGREVDLTATEFSLLESLLRRRGERVCSRFELLQEVWQTPKGVVEGGVGANIVEVYINYLRKKLNGPSGRSAQAAIRTVRGKGYVLDAGERSWQTDQSWSVMGPLAGAMEQGWAGNV